MKTTTVSKILIINYLLYEQNSSAHATRTFFSTFLRRPLHDYDMKLPNATFYGGNEHTMMNFPPSF